MNAIVMVDINSLCYYQVIDAGSSLLLRGFLMKNVGLSFFRGYFVKIRKKAETEATLNESIVHNTIKYNKGHGGIGMVITIETLLHPCR
ncbi:MAG: hypothetical protein ABI472_08455 [Ginsengibacter sp.]